MRECFGEFVLESFAEHDDELEVAERAAWSAKVTTRIFAFIRLLDAPKVREHSLRCQDYLPEHIRAPETGISCAAAATSPWAFLRRSWGSYGRTSECRLVVFGEKCRLHRRRGQEKEKRGRKVRKSHRRPWLGFCCVQWLALTKVVKGHYVSRNSKWEEERHQIGSALGKVSISTPAIEEPHPRILDDRQFDRLNYFLL